MRYIFDPQFFEEKQKVLLKFANTKIGRWFFRIYGDRSDVGKRKIIKIEPNAITWKKGQEFQTEFRTHNKFSKRLYHGLYPLWFLAHQWDTLIANPLKQPEWNLGFDTLTVYPDANAETDTVDGFVRHDVGAAGVSWATLVAAAGNNVADATASGYFMVIQRGTDTDAWKDLRRGIFLFKTSALTAGASISAAVMSIEGQDKGDGASITPDLNVYSSAPALNTELAVGDFDSLGTTAFATAITYSGFNAAGYNNFTLNASGIAAIDKVGISKFGVRNANYDASGTPPTWASGGAYSHFICTFAETAGTTSDPKLVVTYTAAASGPANLKTINGLAKASVKTINGLAIASVKNWNGLT
jgi:hypothetical protein